MIRLEMTEEQAHLLVRALDLYSRIGIGQFKEILYHPTIDNTLMETSTPDKSELKVGDETMRGKVVEIGKDYIKTEGTWGNGIEIRKWEDVEKVKKSPEWGILHVKEDEIVSLFNNIKRIIGMGHWGIHNPLVDNSCRVAYDIQQVVRHELWKHEKDKYYISVASSILLTSGKDSEKIKCETVKNG